MNSSISSSKRLVGERFQAPLLIVVLLLIAAPLFVAGSRLFPVDVLMHQRLKYWPEKANKIEAVTLGGSHSVAIDFKTIGLEGFHLWTAGQDLVESELMYKRFVADRANVRTILMVVPFFLFETDNSLSERKSMRRKVYYYTKAYKQIDNLDDLVVTALLPLIRPDNWRVLFDERKTKVISEDGQRLRSARPRENQNRLSEQAGQKRAARHLSNARLSQSKKRDLETELFYRLDSLVATMAGEGKRVVLYTPPYSKYYLKYVPQAEKDATRALITRIVSRHSNAEYLDFSDLPQVTSDWRCFHDSDHLNLYGAQVFSQVLKKHL